MRMRHGWCLLGLAAILGMGLSSCSETDTLLNWDQADRGGLGVPPDTVVSSSLVVANAEYLEPLTTGSSTYLLVGHLERDGLVEDATHVGADAYIKWDTSTLPDGEVVSAYLNFILHDLDEAGADVPEVFDLQLFRVTEAWEEDSLGLYLAPPALEEVGYVFGGEVDVTSINDTTDLAIDQLFQSPADARLDSLVTDWIDDPSSNHGLAIRMPVEPDQQGFLRFLSREGFPVGEAFTDTTGIWPQLFVEVEGGEGDVESDSLAAVAAGYIIYGGTSDGKALTGSRHDDGLLLSSAYVQPLIFKVNLDSLLASDPERFPPGLAVHQATLTLTTVTGHEWSLPEEDEFTVSVFQTDYEWSEENPPPPGELTGPQVSVKTVSGTDTEVVFDIRDMVQLQTEGESLSVVIFPQTGSGLFRTILFEDRLSQTGPPEFQMIFTRPSDGRIDLESN